jgi:hypothetical protein
VREQEIGSHGKSRRLKEKGQTDSGSQPEAVESHIVSPAWEQIAGLTYSFWEARGYQGGSPEEDWFRAAQELAHPQMETARSRPLRSKAAKVGA